MGKDTLSVYTGTFDIKTELSAPASAPKGATEIVGKLSYQACNNQMCFRPASVAVRVPVTVQ